jgi:peroxiredoxin Q/BCP
MRDDYHDFTALGAEIIVVARHEKEKMRAYWKKEKLPFLGISDPEGKITSRFAQQWKFFSLGRMPAQFVLDCQGNIALAHYSKSMADILSNRAVLQSVRDAKKKDNCGSMPPQNEHQRE